MPTIQREIRKRGFIGHVFKWLFIIFNILMALWLLAYWSKLGDLTSHVDSDAGRAGAVIGAALGTSMLVFFWAAGDIILGLFTLLTRGKKILITEETR